MKTVPTAQVVIPGKLKFKKRQKTANSQGLIQEAKDKKTPAEQAFIEAQRQKQTLRIGERLKVSHKERMETYNKLLGSLPEHFDLPKSSSG